MGQTQKITQSPQEGYLSFLFKNITNQFNKDACRTKVREQIIGSLIFWYFHTSLYFSSILLTAFSNLTIHITFSESLNAHFYRRMFIFQKWEINSLKISLNISEERSVSNFKVSSNHYFCWRYFFRKGSKSWINK